MCMHSSLFYYLTFIFMIIIHKLYTIEILCFLNIRVDRTLNDFFFAESPLTQVSAAAVQKVPFLKSPRPTLSPVLVSGGPPCHRPPTMLRSSQDAGSGLASLTGLETLIILITNPFPERSAQSTSRRAASSLGSRLRRSSVLQPPPPRPLGQAPSLAAFLCLQFRAIASRTKPASRSATSCLRSVVST